MIMSASVSVKRGENALKNSSVKEECKTGAGGRRGSAERGMVKARERERERKEVGLAGAAERAGGDERSGEGARRGEVRGDGKSGREEKF